MDFKPADIDGAMLRNNCGRKWLYMRYARTQNRVRSSDGYQKEPFRKINDNAVKNYKCSHLLPNMCVTLFTLAKQA